MIFKPENVVDLETGAIVSADVRPGDEHDTADLTGRLLAAEKRMNQAVGDPQDTERVEAVAADKGYFKTAEITQLQELNIEAVITDPLTNRRLDKLTVEQGFALDATKLMVASDAGKILLKRRAELVERSFYQVLDCGGARRTTLRGRENIRKRYLIQAACANLSLLMRHLTGLGTPKQALAACRAAQTPSIRRFWGVPLRHMTFGNADRHATGIFTQIRTIFSQRFVRFRPTECAA